MQSPHGKKKKESKGWFTDMCRSHADFCSESGSVTYNTQQSFSSSGFARMTDGRVVARDSISDHMGARG